MIKSEKDRRAIRTKKMIRKALSELIEEKGFSNISITDLTTRADINRGTFYLHYADKYDLLESVENEILLELETLAKTYRTSLTSAIDPLNHPIPFAVKLFEYFQENAKLITAILGPNGDPLFRRKLQKYLKINFFEKELANVIRKENLLIPEDYFSAYLLAAHLSVVEQWLENGMKETPAEMALILTKMSLLGPYKVAGFKNEFFSDL